MQTLFDEYLKIFENCHADIVKLVEALPPAALDWAPGPETNSISVLIYHLTGSERFWIGDVALQESSNRDRDAEFRVRNVSVEQLKGRLTESLNYIRKALGQLTLEDLNKSQSLPDGRTYTVAYALLHAIDHAAQHLGHMQLTSQMWKQTNSTG